MPRIVLIHWNAEEGKERAQIVRAAGYQIDCIVPKGMTFLRELKRQLPVAIVIDLERLPMQGRDVGAALRLSKATRQVPLVFAGGEPAKVDRVKQILPDAIYADWTEIAAALKRALSHRPAEPVTPSSVLAGYAGTPLVDKLGIKEHSTVALINAPAGFLEDLGELPPGATVREPPAKNCSVILWFVRSREEFELQIDWMATLVQKSMWIIWPKKSSGLSTDLSQQIVRKAANSAELVDYKICAIDATWSGLLFTHRRRT